LLQIDIKEKVKSDGESEVVGFPSKLPLLVAQQRAPRPVGVGLPVDIFSFGGGKQWCFDKNRLI
jgi:hypothetical protein